MSRSRKKVPCYTNYKRKYTAWAKRQASKKVRHYKETISDGKKYKKLYLSWDIRDYVCFDWYGTELWWLEGADRK